MCDCLARKESLSLYFISEIIKLCPKRESDDPPTPPILRPMLAIANLCLAKLWLDYRKSHTAQGPRVLASGAGTVYDHVISLA